jgi:16S rRNA (adenine1518-N6/adenine1519-N6)-dimethyltransferase
MPKRLGQHFLKNRSALRRIAEMLEPMPGETVIEIGPGHGELTEFLRTANSEQRIVLIEKDEKLCGSLKEKFRGDGHVTIVEGDALKLLPVLIKDLRLEIQGYKIVGNIPYYITGHLFRVLSELGHKPVRCVFTMQKEVALRMCAVPPRMNRLAASVQFWADAQVIQTLPANDFQPAPKVASAIVLIKTIKAPAPSADYYAAVRALFAQPRKTILNNLMAGTGEKKEVIVKKLSTIHVPSDDRPQNLNVKDIAAIAEMFLFKTQR